MANRLRGQSTNWTGSRHCVPCKARIACEISCKPHFQCTNLGESGIPDDHCPPTLTMYCLFGQVIQPCVHHEEGNWHPVGVNYECCLEYQFVFLDSTHLHVRTYDYNDDSSSSYWLMMCIQLCVCYVAEPCWSVWVTRGHLCTSEGVGIHWETVLLCCAIYNDDCAFMISTPVLMIVHIPSSCW